MVIIMKEIFIFLKSQEKDNINGNFKMVKQIIKDNLKEIICRGMQKLDLKMVNNMMEKLKMEKEMVMELTII